MRGSRLQFVGAVLGATWVALLEEEGGDQVVEGVRVLAALVRDDYDVAKFVLESEDD